MRRAALNLAVAAHGFPGKTETFRERQIALAAIINVAADLTIGLQLPAKHPKIIEFVTDAKRHQQHAFENHQLRQRGGVVVLLEFPEVGGEAFILEKRALNGRFGHLEAAVAVVQVVQPEHVLNHQRLAQAQLQIETEQQLVAQTHHIPGDGVVFGSHPGPAQHVHAGTAKDLFAGLVQPGHLLTQLPALLFQPALDGFKG